MMQRKRMLQTSDPTRKQSFYQRQNKSTQEKHGRVPYLEVEAADNKLSGISTTILDRK